MPKVSKYDNEDFVDQYNQKPLYQDWVSFPALLYMRGDLKGKKVLDLGSGSGEFAGMMADKGANVTASDKSEKWLQICKVRNEGKAVSCEVADGTNMRQYKDNSFDRVVVSMVLLNIPTKEEVGKIFKETSRVLNSEGVLVFSDLHPISLMVPKTHTERQNYLDNFSYFEDGSGFKSSVLMQDGWSRIEFDDVHWTLETYTQLLEEAGLYIHRLHEPRPAKGAPKEFDNYTFPELLIFGCKKLPN